VEEGRVLTLAAKLGLPAGARETALGAPRDVLEALHLESPDVVVEYKPLAGVYKLRPSAFLWCFCSLESELKRALPALRRVLEDEGMLWISWPRKSSWKRLGIDPALAITEEMVRSLAVPLGLVDAQACTVDDVWSGLKLVVRQDLRS
jgi:hypothetical protein